MHNIDEPVQLDKSASHPEYESAKWSVVPFKEPDSAAAPITANVHTSSSAQLMNKSSLTWWKDPEDPSERMALDDL